MVSHGGDSKVARVPGEIVLDASVAVKWFTEEENTDLALKIRDRYFKEDLTIYAPVLIIYEVENALRFKPDVDEDLVSEWVKDLLNMQFELIASSHELCALSIDLSFKHEISAYDGTYLALARLLGAKVITDDGRFYKSTEDTGRVLKLAETE